MKGGCFIKKRKKAYRIWKKSKHKPKFKKTLKHDCCVKKRNCECMQNRCRKNLCNDHFNIRLEGLNNGLNFRLRQLFGKKIELELDTGNKVIGTLSYTGSNFIEILLDKTQLLESDLKGKQQIEYDIDDSLAESIPKDALQVEKNQDSCKKMNCQKDRIWIIPINKIVYVETTDNCRRSCKCFKNS